MSVVIHRSGGVAVGDPGPQRLRSRVMFLEHHLTENMLVADGDGTLFVGVTCARPGAHGGLLRSRDRGVSWQRVVPDLPGSADSVLNASMCTVTLDPRTRRLFATSMGDPTCPVEGEWAEKIARLTRKRATWSDTLAYSDDQGDSWHVVRGQFRDGGDWGKTFLGPPATAESRRALAANRYPNVIYHCTGATFSMTSYCFRSLDGGASWQLTASPVFSDYAGRTPLPYGSAPEVPAGYPRDDKHTLSGIGVVTADGSVYVPANINGFARLYVSKDDGDSWSHLDIPVANVRGKKTYGRITGFQEPPNGGRPLKPQQPFHALYGSTAMSALWSQQLTSDRADTFYLAWIDALDDLPYLSVSRDRGGSWSTPRMVAPPGVNVASISAIAVREPGEVAIAYYGSRDGGETYDGFLTVTHDALEAEPRFQSCQASAEAPIQYNRLSEPIEYVGLAFAPDGTAWASFARDTGVIDPASDARQCDGTFKYNGDRFFGVVMCLERA